MKKIKAVKVARLLGTTTRAGARRAVSSLRVRKAQFAKRIQKVQLLRKIRVNIAAMPEAAAATSMLYGGDCCGTGDNMLEEVRRATAKICVGDAGGKSMVRSLCAVDGSSGTANPAFLAHLNPIVALSKAWWEAWVDHDCLSSAHERARAKLSSAEASIWSVVNGSVTAVIATTSRLGWTMDSPHSVVDDAGTKWDFRVDPPAALKKAVKQSVRRWRLQQAAADIPALVPKCSDISGVRLKETVIIDCSAAAISALTKGRAKHKDPPAGEVNSGLTSLRLYAEGKRPSPGRQASPSGG